MPWRNRYITTRRHPLAVAAYVFTFLLGVFSLTGVFDSTALNAAIGEGWQIAWQWLLTLGGAIALAGVAWPQKHLDDALSLESSGAAAVGTGLIVYSMAVVMLAGWSVPVWLLLGALAVGSFYRSWQARADRHRVELLSRTLMEQAGQ